MSSRTSSQYQKHECIKRSDVDALEAHALRTDMGFHGGAFYKVEDALIYLDRHLAKIPRELKTAVEEYYFTTKDLCLVVYTQDNKVIIVECLS